MKSMGVNQVCEFLNFLENRLERHHINIANASFDHRVLIKTERPETVGQSAYYALQTGKKARIILYWKQ
jgi:hypothetical protein